MSDVPVTEAPEAEVTPPAPEATPAAAPEAEAPAEATPAPEVEVDPKLKEVQREAQSLRKRLRETEAELQSRKEAEMTEVEKAQQRAEQAEKAAVSFADRLKAATLTAAVAIEAGKHGIEPALATKLVRDDVEYDDQDNPTNVGDLLTALAKSHPQLVSAQAPTAGSVTNPAAGEQPPETDAQRLARLTGRQDNDPNLRPDLHGGGVVYAGASPLD